MFVSLKTWAETWSGSTMARTWFQTPLELSPQPQLWPGGLEVTHLHVPRPGVSTY